MGRPPEFPRLGPKVDPGSVTAGRAEGAPPYAELQCFTNFSFLEGASHPAELVAQAKALGHVALGVADRNTLAGVVRAHAAAKKAGLRLVPGARLDTTEPDGQPGFSVIAYPTDRAAWGRLAKLITRGRRAAPKGECFITLEDVIEHGEGQVFIIVPPDDLACPLFAPRVARLATLAPGRTWLAVSMLHRGTDRARALALRALAAETGARLVATNAVIMHGPERRALADVVTCIRDHVTITQAGFRLATHAERHLKPPAEMARLFAAFPEAIAAIPDVLSFCRFNLDELAYNYPDEAVVPGVTPAQHLRALAWSGAAWRYPEGVPKKVKAAIEKELALIAELKYEKYFLTVHDIVRFARSRGILCQGRGSAANSAVCYCLAITAVDPSTTSLLFERFISAARKEPPDIDVDFEHERREEVMQYIYARYGRANAAIAATVITYRPRSAVREVGKAMGLTEDVTAALANAVWGSWGREIDGRQVKQAGLDLDDPHLARVIALTQELLGFPRHLSQHVGGFVLTADPLEEIVPIGNAAMEDRTFIEWDKDDLDELKILKVDVLALGMLTCLAKSFAMIRDHHGRDLDLATMPKEDPAVYDMLCRADAIGVFQVESRAQLNMLPRLKPRKFYDLVIEVAIVRPGPIQGDMVHPYLRRRDGIERVDYPSPGADHGPPDELERVLGRTLGVPLFQEQAMQIAIDAAKFTPDEANELRRAMATFRRVGTIGTLQDKMVGRMVERGYDPDFARRCFDQIKGFGEYGFPESHAASFALLVYASAWVKCHYPEVFCAALLNAQPMGFYAPAQIVRDAREHRVIVKPVCLNASFFDNVLERDDDGTLAVRLGFRQLDGLRREVMEAFTARRAAHGAFVDVDEARRIGGLSVAVLERLAAADALRSLEDPSRPTQGLDRRQGLWDVRGVMSDRELPLFAAANADPAGPDIPAALPEMPLSEHVIADYQTARLSLKAHPMAFLRDHYRQARIIAAHDLFARRHGDRVRVAGVVLVRQRPGTAKGVVFMTLEDETGIANIVVWKKIMEDNRKAVMQARLVEIEGEVQRKDDIIHVVARKVIDRSGDLALLADDGVRDFAAPLARADEVARPIPEDQRITKMRARIGPLSNNLPLPLPDPNALPLTPDPNALPVRPAPTITQPQPLPRGHQRNIRVIPKSRDFH